MEQVDPELAVVRQARWLLEAYRDGGAAVSEEDLRDRVGERMREEQFGDSLDVFRQKAEADDITVTGLRGDGEQAIIDVRTPGGLRLERVVRLDPDGRLGSMTTRLAGGASMTMVSAAAWRAAHTAFDDPVILADTFASRLIGDASPYQVDAVRNGTHGTQGMHYRWNMAARARLGEDTLTAQRDACGVRQYVLLGAGLDTFALRNPFPDVTVFEVDIAESQAWKLDRLAQTGLMTPDNVQRVTCDFEDEDFVDRLVGVGFDPGKPAVAAWLGVSYYLTEEAIRATLERVGSWPAGSAIVFDYMLAQDQWDEVDGFDAGAMRAVIESVAAAGEPFLSFFGDDELIELCRSCGFDEIELLGHDEIRARFMPDRSGPTPGPDPVLKLACALV